LSEIFSIKLKISDPLKEMVQSNFGMLTEEQRRIAEQGCLSLRTNELAACQDKGSGDDMGMPANHTEIGWLDFPFGSFSVIILLMRNLFRVTIVLYLM
jgi:hypothetical protein